MIVLQLPSVLSVDSRDYSCDRPRTLQNDSLLRRSILFLRMLIEEIKIATRPRCLEERKGRVEATRELPIVRANLTKSSSCTTYTARTGSEEKLLPCEDRRFFRPFRAHYLAQVLRLAVWSGA
jgi:hypothetical protein